MVYEMEATPDAFTPSGLVMAADYTSWRKNRVMIKGPGEVWS